MYGLNHGKRKCGEAKFPKSPYDRLIRQKPSGLRGRRCNHMPDCYIGGKTKQPSKYIASVLIYDWQEKRREFLECDDKTQAECCRCVDLRAAGAVSWSPDAVLRNIGAGRNYPITFGPAQDLTNCRHVRQLKSWYDQDYNDTAKRYLKEKVYDPREGVPPRDDMPWREPKVWKFVRLGESLNPRPPVVECTATNHGLLERKQIEWSRGRDWLQDLRTPSSVYRKDFIPAVDQSPADSAGSGSHYPSRRIEYETQPKMLPTGETAPCIVCTPEPYLPPCCKPVGNVA